MMSEPSSEVMTPAWPPTWVASGAWPLGVGDGEGLVEWGVAMAGALRRRCRVIADGVIEAEDLDSSVGGNWS